MSSKRPFAAWYEKDYRAKTAWFTDADQHAIYRTLLCEYGLNGPLVNDEDELRALCILQLDRWQRWWPKIRDRFFVLEDDGRLHNSRADEEWSIARTRIGTTEQQTQAGGIGGRVRWAKERAAKAAGDLEGNEREAVIDYAAVAARHDFQPVQALTPERRGRLAACIEMAGGIAGWRVALETISANGFLRGEGKRGWKPDFDWITNPENFTRLMEGYYERKERSAAAEPAAKPGGRPTLEEALRANRAAIADVDDPLDALTRGVHQGGADRD
jgi:uncharacterized protein YdaU (DUF1376 family)